MGFFGDLKADITQAVDELTDGTEAENTRKDNKKSFGKKGKKQTGKIASNPVSEEKFTPAAEASEERSETEKELWDALRSDYSSSTNDELDAEMNAAYAQSAADVLTEDDVVEELAEIEENEVLPEREVPMANHNVNQNTKKQTKEYVLPEGTVSDELGVITAGMAVLGNIYSTGHMEIYGSVEGDVEVSGSLRILGSIVGNVKANEVILENGKIKGNVTCGTVITIANNCVVIGDIVSGTGAGIAGAVKGDIDVHGPVTLESTSIVKGNIKSASVQMANGAMVDGMCSQCYSDVDLSSFFDNI